mmetsp:Transcript_96491/g.277132  ORF Transcript_96491/g.277132 Transcript_96491/m.277132 type:complete len:493 (-) Transcript_96491:129-1607(-)
MSAAELCAASPTQDGRDMALCADTGADAVACPSPPHAVLKNTISEEEVAAATAGDSSPVGAALLYLRRARAFGARAHVNAMPKEVVQAPSLCDEARAVDGLGISQADLDALSMSSEGELGGQVERRAAAPCGGLSQAELDELCSFSAEGGAGERSPTEGPEETLGRVKRFRAFRGAAGAAAAAEEAAAKVYPATSSTSAATHGEGLSQAELDAMCMFALDGGDLSEMTGPEESLLRTKRLRTFAAFAAQPEVDPAAAGDTAAGRGLSQAELDALCIDGADDESSAPGPEEALGKLKRLYAFRGAAEARAFAEASRPEASKPANPSDARGLSQAELDALMVVDGGEEAVSPAALTPEQPEALCFLLRRTRAFAGAEAAEKLAAEVDGSKAEETPSVAKPSVGFAEEGTMVKINSGKAVVLPMNIKRSDSPPPALLGRERSLSQSPSKDIKDNDAWDKVATPNRQGKNSLVVPSGKNAGGLSPTNARSPMRGGC